MRPVSVIILGIVFLGSISVSRSAAPPLCTDWNTKIKSVCNAISFFHNIFQVVFRPERTLRHCEFLKWTPHCCEQFCIPAKGRGTCEEDTGVCRCKGNGTPEMCNVYLDPNLKGGNDTVFEICRKRCASGTSPCRTPAYINDSYNYMCICYCP